MRVAVAGLIGLAVFLTLDVLRVADLLTSSGSPTLRLDRPSVAPMLVFRLLHVAGLLYFAIVPALHAASLVTAGLRGAAFGGAAFLIYAVADRTLLRGWAGGVDVGDVAWATVASSISSLAAYRLTAWITG